MDNDEVAKRRNDDDNFNFDETEKLEKKVSSKVQVKNGSPYSPGSPKKLQTRRGFKSRNEIYKNLNFVVHDSKDEILFKRSNSYKPYFRKRPQIAIQKKEGFVPENLNSEEDFKTKNDINILKFLLEKRREEVDSAGEGEKKDKDYASIIENIIGGSNNEAGEEVKINENLKKEVLFEVHQIYDHYNNKLKAIDESNPQILKKLKLLEAKKQNKENEMKGSFLVNFGVILEGSAISYLLEPELRDLFWEIIKKSRSVICCRCNPLQKAAVVKFVKEKSNEIVLAIGDGGNDVNMITEANVGVGIFGKEGYQAAYSSDYAISQFKYLHRLIFNHGRYYILRNTYFILFYLFKNTIFSLPQFWYMFFNGYSGANIYDSWYYLGYEFIFTNIPHGFRMLYEEDIDIEFADYPPSIKKLVPDIYQETRDNKPFSVRKYVVVFLVSFYQTIILYFFPYIAFNYGIIDYHGRNQGYYDNHLVVYLSIICIQFIIMIDDSFFWNKNVFIAYIANLSFLAIFVFIYDLMDWATMNHETYGIVGNPTFWLTLGLTVIISVLPVSVYQKLNTLFNDGIISNIRIQKYEYGLKKKNITKKIEQIGELTRSFAKFKKILNDTKFQADNHAEKKIKVLVDQYNLKYDKKNAQSNANLFKCNVSIKDEKSQRQREKEREAYLSNLINRSIVPSEDHLVGARPTVGNGEENQISNENNIEIELEKFESGKPFKNIKNNQNLDSSAFLGSLVDGKYHKKTVSRELFRTDFEEKTVKPQNKEAIIDIDTKKTGIFSRSMSNQVKNEYNKKKYNADIAIPVPIPDNFHSQGITQKKKTHYSNAIEIKMTPNDTSRLQSEANESSRERDRIEIQNLEEDKKDFDYLEEDKK